MSSVTEHNDISARARVPRERGHAAEAMSARGSCRQEEMRNGGVDETRRVLAAIGDAVGAETLSRYLGRSAELTVDTQGLLVRAPSRFAAEMIERRLGGALRDAIGDRPIRYEVGVSGTEAPRRPAPGREPHPGIRATNAPPRPGAGGSARRRSATAGVNPNQTLDNFVVGSCNKFAFAAAARLAEGQGTSGPVFLYGPCGVGKSHLLNATVNRFRLKHPGARTKLVTAESFTNEYIAAVRSNTIESFHRQYRRVDLLCIDDVHFLANKNGTQNELLHTFDHLATGGGRIVLASDAHPGAIRQFSDALVSRFVSGSLVKIDAPDADTRRRLIAHFAARAGLRFAPGASALLEAVAVGEASGRRVSVRDLAGVVNRVRAYLTVVGGQTSGGGEIGAPAVEAAIRAQGGVVPGRTPSPSAGHTGRPVPIATVIDRVCEALEVTRNDLAGKGRHPRVVLARAGVTLLARRLTRHSYPEIAAAIGRSNHSTVITAHRRIEKQIEAGTVVRVGLPTDGMPVGVLIEQIERSARGGG
jgi:chromosomal replication initiator protein